MNCVIRMSDIICAQNRIVLRYDIGIDKKIIESALPVKLKDNLISVSRSALRERMDALQHMSVLNIKITNLQKRELKDVLHSVVHMDSQDINSQIRSIICKPSPHVIGDGYPLFLPDSIHAEIVCSMNAREQAIRGRIIFDLNELKKFIAETITHLSKIVLRKVSNAAANFDKTNKWGLVLPRYGGKVISR